MKTDNKIESLWKLVAQRFEELQNLFQETGQQLGTVGYACNPSYLGSQGRRFLSLEDWPSRQGSKLNPQYQNKKIK
jgi:hypothetical protein